MPHESAGNLLPGSGSVPTVDRRWPSTASPGATSTGGWRGWRRRASASGPGPTSSAAAPPSCPPPFGGGGTPLRRGLGHPNPAVRASCAQILDRLLDDDAIPDLVAALDDPDAMVVKRALHSLACDACKTGACRPGDDLFVPKAIELARRDPRPVVRAAAFDALAQ